MQNYLLVDPIGPSVNRPENMFYTTFFSLFVFHFIVWVSRPVIIDPDIYWHIFIGNQILSSHHFPTHDEYSHTLTKTPWIAKEWLSQVIFALAYRLAGWSGIVLMTALSVSLAFAVLAHELLRRLTIRAVLPLMAVAFLCVSPTLVPRPHILALPVMMIWFAVLFRAAEAARPPPLYAALLIPLWANLHGSFLFGLGFGGILVVESVLRAQAERRWKVLAGWVVFGLLSALGTIMHPYGVEALLAAKRVLDLGPERRYITEWNPSDFSSFSTLEALLLLGIAAALSVGYRLSLFRILLLLVLLHMSLAHSRHLALLGLLAPLVLALSLASWQGAADSVASRSRLVPAALFGVLATLVTLSYALIRPLEPIKTYAPEAALQAARAAGLSGNVLNDYDFGGFLLSQNVPTFIDGRTELFGGPFLKETMDVLNGQKRDHLDVIITRHNIGWTLLKPQSPLVADLSRSPQWQKVYQDNIAVVHVRR